MKSDKLFRNKVCSDLGVKFSESDFFVQSEKGLLSKRLFDIILSLLAIMFFMPLGMIIALAIFLQDGGPVFYSQVRVGKGGKFFGVLKFRSMVPNAEKQGDLGGNREDIRITKIGRILRNTAMDELPQLVNILKGDMSFVGPRAERPYYFREFEQANPDYKLRAKIRPALISLDDVCNCEDLPELKKLNRQVHYERFYLKKMSLSFDLRIILSGLKTTLKLDWGTTKRKF